MKKKGKFFFSLSPFFKTLFFSPSLSRKLKKTPPNKLTVEVREPLGDLRAPSRGVLVRVVTLDGSHGRMLLRRRWSRARGGGARRGMLLLLLRRRRRSQARPLRLRLRCHDPLERAPTDEGLHNVAVFVYQRSSFFLGGVGEVVNVFFGKRGRMGVGRMEVEFAAAARRTSRGSRGSILPPPLASIPPEPRIQNLPFTSGRLACPDADVLGDVLVAQAAEHPRLVREVDGVERRPATEALDGDPRGQRAGRGAVGGVLRDLDCFFLSVIRVFRGEGKKG